MIGYETRVVIKEGQEPGSLTTISATVKTPTDGNGPGIFMEIKRKITTYIIREVDGILKND